MDSERGIKSASIPAIEVKRFFERQNPFLVPLRLQLESLLEQVVVVVSVRLCVLAVVELHDLSINRRLNCTVIVVQVRKLYCLIPGLYTHVSGCIAHNTTSAGVCRGLNCSDCVHREELFYIYVLEKVDRLLTHDKAPPYANEQCKCSADVPQSSFKGRLRNLRD